MAYTRNGTPGSPLLSVEQARRRNAELRIELAALTAEYAILAPLVEAKRRDVEAARMEVVAPSTVRAKRGEGSRHGTARRYEMGCKCDPCRAVKKAKDARYKANRAAKKQAA